MCEGFPAFGPILEKRCNVLLLLLLFCSVTLTVSSLESELVWLTSGKELYALNCKGKMIAFFHKKKYIYKKKYIFISFGF